MLDKGEERMAAPVFQNDFITQKDNGYPAYLRGEGCFNRFALQLGSQAVNGTAEPFQAFRSAWDEGNGGKLTRNSLVRV